MDWIPGAIMLTAGVLGLALTLITLPGYWLAAVAALLVQWAWPGTFHWGVLGAAVGLCVLAEVVDLLAGAVGAKRVGGTRRAAVGAIAGGLIGAILGTPIAPVVGTVLGAAAGAGIGAAVMDRTKEDRTWVMSSKVGAGAAVGRFVAIIVKSVIAALVATMLIVAAFAP